MSEPSGLFQEVDQIPMADIKSRIKGANARRFRGNMAHTLQISTISPRLSFHQESVFIQVKLK